MHYFEQATPDGRWVPCTQTTRPETKVVHGVERLALSGGTGPRVRAIAKLPGNLAHMTLTQLRACMSPDGAFIAGKYASEDQR